MSEDVGYIRLYRKIKGWEWYADGNTFRVFIHLLLSVNREPKKHRGIALKAGDVLTGRTKLASETGLSEQNIRTALQHLELTKEITIDARRNCSIITILNWKEYQPANQPANQQVTNSQPTGNQQVTTNKKDNKEEKEEKSKREKITLEKLSAEHISEWLEKRREKGDYRSIDEHKLLDKFKNWCESKGKKYSSYVAAYRNSFEWDNAPQITKKKGQASDWDF